MTLRNDSPLGDGLFPCGNASAPGALQHNNQLGWTLDNLLGLLELPRWMPQGPVCWRRSRDVLHVYTSLGEIPPPGERSTLGGDHSRNNQLRRALEALLCLLEPPHRLPQGPDCWRRTWTPPQTPCSSRKHGRSFPLPAAPERTDGAGGDSRTASTRSPR